MLPDADLKLNHCVSCADYIIEVAIALGSGMPYEQRFMVRPFFIALDVFLTYVGNVKNEAKNNGAPRADVVDIEARIARLQSEYKDSFALVRDKMVAHRQKEDLLTLFEHWVQVDQVAGVVLRDDMLDIYDRLAALQAVPERAMPAEIPDAIAAAQRFGTETTRPWWDLSLYALANQNSGAVLPTSPMLEKLQQALAAVTGILVFNRIVSKLPQSGILEFLRAQVGVVDLCSLLDNVFLDRPDDEGLVTRWQKMKHRGSAILLGFRRRPALEEVLRLARGKVLAHLDSDSTWADMSLIVSMIPWADVGTYYNELWHTMKRALAAEMATALYAGHGEEMHESVVGMAKTVKPFLA